MLRKRSKVSPLALEDSLEYGWVAREETREVPVSPAAFWVMGTITLIVIGVVAVRILILGVGHGTQYAAQAAANVEHATPISAPRGIITDRYGVVLADNKPAFSLLLDLHEFLKDPAVRDQTLATLQSTLGLAPDDVLRQVNDYAATGHTDPLVLYRGLSQPQTIAFTSANLPTLLVRQGYERDYPDGPAFATVLGYTGLPTPADLKKHADLANDEVIGKSGLETVYDTALRGIAGKTIEIENARGKQLGGEQTVDPKPGSMLQLTIDAGFQKYFYDRLASGLRSLGRTGGAGIALDPKTGQVLALVSMPSYDNNAFADSTRSDERAALVTDPTKPLYNRAVSGEYSPGSTIKPLVAAAVLQEHIVDPSWSIFSPGYLDVANPYDPSHPTRFLDWRYQGTINVYSALAQSSDVYFYAVGGGIPGLKGLGITQLREWWQKFHLGD